MSEKSAADIEDLIEEFGNASNDVGWYSGCEVKNLEPYIVKRDAALAALKSALGLNRPSGEGEEG